MNQPRQPKDPPEKPAPSAPPKGAGEHEPKGYPTSDRHETENQAGDA